MRAESNIHEFKNWWLPSLTAIVFFIAGILLEVRLLFLIPFLVLFVPLFLETEFRSLYLLLLFFIPLSTELAVTSSFSTDMPDELFMLLLTGGLIGSFFTRPRLFPKAAMESSLFVVLILQLVWLGIAVSFSHDKVLSLKYFVAKIWYIVPFVLGTLVFLQTKKDFRVASRVLVFSLCIPVVVSLVRHAFYGFTFESINDTVGPFFRNHVSYSALLVCLLPVVFAWYYFSVGVVRKATIGLILLLLTALFFAYSRGAWLCLVTGYITWWAIRKKIMLSLIGISLVLTLLSVTWLIKDDNYMKFAPDFNKTFFRTNFSEHLQATYQLKDISTMERFYRWVAGVKMVQAEALTGFGPNTFYSQYKQYTVAAFKTWVSNNDEKSTVHNYFLLTAIEQGLPALVLLLLMLVLMFRTAVRAYHQLTDPFDQTLALLCGVILSMIFTLNLLSDLIETDKIGSLYFILLGVLMHLELKVKQTGFLQRPAGN